MPRLVLYEDDPRAEPILTAAISEEELSAIVRLVVPPGSQPPTGIPGPNDTVIPHREPPKKMNKEEFFQGLDNRPADMTPLVWLASLGDKRPPDASRWLMEWLKR